MHMIIHRFRDVPDFPFARYYEDPAQFIQAQRCWLAVLRETEGFDEALWHPTPRAENLADDMYLGKVLDLVAPLITKAMSVQTFSLEGDINMALHENGPMDPVDVPRFLDPVQRAAIIAGTPEDKLYRDTIAHHAPLMAWVEKTTIWHAEAGHAAGGAEVAVERLILTSTISEVCEPLARQALALFLQDGPAAERVNAAFP
jgi:hypothetical protein